MQRDGVNEGRSRCSHEQELRFVDANGGLTRSCSLTSTLHKMAYYKIIQAVGAMTISFTGGMGRLLKERTHYTQAGRSRSW